MAPTVSLSMPVYNGEKYIAQAIDSILAQDFTDFELIVTDNASTDRTEEICRDYAAREPRILYVRNATNIGAAGNFNLGFELAKGAFFKWCAHDDRISPDFIGKSIHALRNDPSAAIAHGRQQGIDAQGQEIDWISGGLIDISDITDDAERFELVFRAQGYDAAMFGLFRRETLALTSLHQSYYSSDIALLAENALLGRFLCTDAIFYNREHENRSINIQDKRARQLWLDTSARNGLGLEHLSLLRHLIGIARKHQDRVSLRRTLPRILRWSASGKQLSRYALETIGIVSPQLQASLARHGRGLVQAAKRSNHGSSEQQPAGSK